MRIAVVGHISIDQIENGERLASLGGPPCYTGLAARGLGSGVDLITRFGSDFPDEYMLWISKNQLQMGPGARSPNSRTTRFKIRQGEGHRILQLLARCDDIRDYEFEAVNAEGCVISPIANEIPPAVTDRISSMDFVSILDPQGYLRAFDPNGFCFLVPRDLTALPKTKIIKVGREELGLLANSSEPLGALEKIASSGYEIVIGTNGSEDITIIESGKKHKLSLPKLPTPADTTGLGDIFNGAFIVSYLKDGDTLWAASLAAGMASSSAYRLGIGKVSSPREYEGLARAILDSSASIS